MDTVAARERMRAEILEEVYVALETGVAALEICRPEHLDSKKDWDRRRRALEEMKWAMVRLEVLVPYLKNHPQNRREATIPSD